LVDGWTTGGESTEKEDVGGEVEGAGVGAEGIRAEETRMGMGGLG